MVGDILMHILIRGFPPFLFFSIFIINISCFLDNGIYLYYALHLDHMHIQTHIERGEGERRERGAERDIRTEYIQLKIIREKENVTAKKPWQCIEGGKEKIIKEKMVKLNLEDYFNSIASSASTIFIETLPFSLSFILKTSHLILISFF